MAILKEGSMARVVDHSGSNNGNQLRSFPIIDPHYEMGYVGFGGTVTLLSGPWKDKDHGRWWVVVVEHDPDDGHERPYKDNTGNKGFMAEITPRTGAVNLESV
jgi:hypothetical protein